jgi:hypothetical protein
MSDPKMKMKMTMRMRMKIKTERLTIICGIYEMRSSETSEDKFRYDGSEVDNIQG